MLIGSNSNTFCEDILSFDFCLSKNAKDALYLASSFSMAEEKHSLLFKMNIKSAMLSRLKDYCRDLKFKSNETVLLLAEVEDLQEENNTSVVQNAILEKIKSLCEQALAADLNVYGFSD